MRKAVFPVLAVALLVISMSGCLQPENCGNGLCEVNETSYSCPEDCGHSGCIGESNSGFEGIDECCPGLSETPSCFEGERACICDDSKFTCTKCGDRVCGQGEDKCNCPADCGALKFDSISVGNSIIRYTDLESVERGIPFSIKLDNSSVENTFAIGAGRSWQTFYYRCSPDDVILKIHDNGYLNGQKLELEVNSFGVQMLADEGWTTIPDQNVSKKVNFGNVQFTAFGFTKSPLSVNLLADGNCEFSTRPFSAADYLELGGAENYTTVDGRAVTKTVYYDDDNAARGPLAIPLYVTNDSINGTYKYRMHVETASSADGSIYLLLDAQDLKTKEGTTISFNGTDTTENGIADRPYYWPDTADFGNARGDYQYMTAQTRVSEGSREIKAMVDTGIGQTLVIPMPGLSYYNGCVYYNSNDYVPCGIDTNNSAVTEAGSKIEVKSRVANIMVAVPGTAPSTPAGS